MSIFATRLKSARKYEGLTQEEFAALLKIPLKTYRNYELTTKNHSDPNFDVLVRIAEILHTTTDYLLGKD